ncbi:hypothetical protein Bhyg_07759 [Pseudolycoriella hygida]|uniref:Uncharacterized protein n=1 Tax=Pseudolycoriella hygida TaxID=35572 RepID=A0A9Q0S452_9DIPT|nr:hypothetical protein Bhyg_07759 [Pseudolycoriella hygida]
MKVCTLFVIISCGEYNVRGDDKNITRLLNNQVIVSRQIMCVLEKSPCDQLGRQLKVIKMPNTMKIFFSLVLIFAIIEILQAQNHCDDTMCNDVCGEAGMNGTCKANNECDCHYDKKCSMLIDKTCDLICKEMKFNGECDENGYCVCKAELEVCDPEDCQEPCEEDPRANECIFVIPDFCMEYGPVKACSCICVTWILLGGTALPEVILRNCSLFT